MMEKVPDMVVLFALIVFMVCVMAICIALQFPML